MENEKGLADSSVPLSWATARTEKKLPWVPAGLETLMDDLKWMYAAKCAGTQADNEQLRNMLFEYVGDPSVYSDGSRTTRHYLTGYKENVRTCDAVKPPHRRCGCENCGCKERRIQEDELREGEVGPFQKRVIPW